MAADVLLVEDSLPDAVLLSEAVKRAHLDYSITHVVDGHDAIVLLQRRLEAGSLPDLLILDLNLPRVTGWQVLSWLNEHLSPADRQTMAIEILTTSSVDREAVMAMGLSGDCYFVKATDFLQFVELVKKMDAFREGGCRKEA